jgi:hypothetical protein
MDSEGSTFLGPQDYLPFSASPARKTANPLKKAQQKSLFNERLAEQAEVEMMEKGGVPRTTMNDTHFKSIMSDFETKNKTSVMTVSISPPLLLTPLS